MMADAVPVIIQNISNTALNQTVTLQDQLGNFWDALITRLSDIVMAPYLHKEMLWIITPMIITIVMMELYFGRYRKEELGWNSAVANSLVLMFVSIDLLRRIYGDDGFMSFLTSELFSSIDIPVKTFIALLLLFYGFLLLFFNFFHIFPKKVAFFISSSLPVNFLAYMAIVVIYSNLPIIESDGYLTLIASMIFLFVLFLFFTILQVLEPKSDNF